jgi:hypothetical protein
LEHNSIKNLEEYASQVTRNVEEGRRSAKRFSEEAQVTNKIRYDTNRQDASFGEGDLVMVYYTIRKVGLSEKLMKRYFGPYRIKERMSQVTFKVEPVDEYDDRSFRPNRRKNVEIINVARMKRYFPREEPGTAKGRSEGRGQTTVKQQATSTKPKRRGASMGGQRRDDASIGGSNVTPNIRYQLRSREIPRVHSNSNARAARTGNR